MKFEMFDIVNYDKWGNLVKEWARNKASRPANLEEFKTQLKNANVGATYPANYTSVEFIETSSTDTVLRIKLPPPEMLKEAEEDLKTQGYALPTFYADDMSDPSLKSNTTPAKLVFHSKRVGEYTIKFCG